MLYGCAAVPVNKVKLWNQQHVLFCSFTIKETNFVLILVHSLQFSEVAAATTNMTDLSRHEYDWRLQLSHMIDSDLTKYDWRWRLGDGGSGDYLPPPSNTQLITRLQYANAYPVPLIKTKRFCSFINFGLANYVDWLYFCILCVYYVCIFCILYIVSLLL